MINILPKSYQDSYNQNMYVCVAFCYENIKRIINKNMIKRIEERINTFMCSLDIINHFLSVLWFPQRLFSYVSSEKYISM